MKIKVCGLRSPKNIEQIDKMPIDFLGFIFYPKSPRHVSSKTLDYLLHNELKTPKVAVFVNEDIQKVEELYYDYKFSYIQLHGGESIDYFQKLREKGVSMIKVFSIQDKLDITEIQKFEPYVDYFLFDTKTNQYGGSGRKFSWDILKDYSLSKKYIVSGGIGVQDASILKHLTNPKLLGIDVNSRFEITPGVKDVSKLSAFIKNMNHESISS